MLGLKKKLSALIPTEGTRDALQNVLTVEWSGHKTVLVEVPEVGPNKSNDVEMGGISDAKRSQYGRLSDDDMVGRAFRPDTSNYFDKPYDLPPPLPPKPSSSKSSSRSASNNPFSSKYQVDEYTSRKQARVAEHFAPQPSSRREVSEVVDEEEYTYRPSTRRTKDSPDLWSGEIWNAGFEHVPTSPTSSTETRHSTPKMENPFGN